ncbi:thiol-disulfide oxidoreductase DCC family protein [Micromonospora sp. DT31]|uniref:thiol-disulfide oxidoreductase DCC family protein n=1 Tax=Micromonospora sp. DT31 TaxID=3393434 RepID=UPI003CEA38AC
MDTSTFVYDGDCAFCTSCARFVERRVPTGARVVPWQFADLAALGLTEAECEEAVQWVDADGSRAAGPDAVARLLGDSGPLWRLTGAGLRLAPVRAAAWPAYRWVARNRHRMPGGTAACALPQEARDRLYGSPGRTDPTA